MEKPGGFLPRIRKRFYDDDGSTQFDVSPNAVSDTPVQFIPQKRDFFASSPARVIEDDENPPMPVAQTTPSVLPLAASVDAVAPKQPDANDAAAMFAPQARLQQDQVNPQTTQTAPSAPTLQTAPTSVEQARQGVKDVTNREYGFKKFKPGDQLEPGQSVDSKGYIVGADGKRVYGKDRDKTHNGWDVLRSIGLGALGGMQNGGLGGAIVGAGIGTVGGIIDRNFDNKLQDQMFGIPKAQRNLSQAEADQDYDTKQKLAETQQQLNQMRINDIPADNELRRLQIDNQKNANAERAQTAAQNKLFAAKYYDPNNPVHRKQAEQAGLNPDDLKGWDDRNPVTKQVAGVTYQYNRTTGTFEPSNIPVEESKTMTDYKVKMPNGEVRTYKVAQKDAANFATQMQALGARLEQDESQFQRTLKQRDKEFQANYGLAQQRIAQEVKNYQLAADKFEEEKRKGAGADKTTSDRLELERKNAAARIVAIRKSILADVVMTDAEKQDLLKDLPDIQ